MPEFVKFVRRQNGESMVSEDNQLPQVEEVKQEDEKSVNSEKYESVVTVATEAA